MSNDIICHCKGVIMLEPDEYIDALIISIDENLRGIDENEYKELQEEFAELFDECAA